MSLRNICIFRLATLSLAVMSACFSTVNHALASDVIEFNTDVLDVKDKENINLSQFSRAGYIMPGVYSLELKVNNDNLEEESIPFYAPPDDPDGSMACLSPEVTAKLALTTDSLRSLTWWHDGQCLDVNSLPGLQLQADLATSSLYVSIPQAYLEYSAPNWDPPSRWDEGVSAIIADYNLNGNVNRSYRGDHNSYALNGNGVTGINVGSWRARADWQGRLNHATGSDQPVNTKFQWTRFYAYRAVPSLAAKLVIGEDYLVSNIFDTFRFIGASLRSDLNMLPPNLRGYAPEVTGIAKTNATVTISQQGRIIYSEQVAPGPYRIQNLNDAISGKLDVKVEEQDGSVQEFSLDTANLPYLTRPGQLQYKLALGKPSSIDRKNEGDNFITGEFSWGISNGWSLFGGSLNSQNYNSLSLGIGRDLLMFGAISADIVHSFAKLKEQGNFTGSAYRLSYAKRFDEIDSQIQFAGYRFAERDYMSMADFLQARNHGLIYGKSKELYTVSLSKNFKDLGFSAFLSYNHQTYWDRKGTDYYSLSVSKYLDIGSVKNVSMSLSANRNMYNGVTDDSLFLSVSMPLENGANIGYSMNSSRYDTVNRVSYYDQINDRTNYQLSSGTSRKGASGSAYISHQGDIARVSANTSYQHNQYSAYGLSASGGLTISPDGAGFHRMNTMGGTRMLVDTDGVPNVPIKGYGAPVESNSFGKAIVGDVNSYYRSKVYIDLNELPNDMEASQTVAKVTLTEGAVGYRKFPVISGSKMMVALSIPGGSYPPFGAQVTNDNNKNTGIVGDEGSTYISGINTGSVMTVRWGKNSACKITFPAHIEDKYAELALQCIPQ